MKVNKELMQKARFEKKLVNDLTVAEFRVLMQETFDANLREIEKRKQIDAEFQHALSMYYKYGTEFPKQCKV